jgi:hypothetical protein
MEQHHALRVVRSEPEPRRRLLACGVIRRKGDTRPTVREVARIDQAFVKITHYPTTPEAA